MISGNSSSPAKKWKMVAIAFLVQNTALGLSYGSFGPLLANTESHFGISRTEASFGVSVALLIFALSSPMVGTLIQRLSIRITLLCGTFASALAYIGLGVTSSYGLAIACYALLGFGTALMGVIAPVTLISRWFTQGRAKAMSIVTLPIFLFITPSLVTQALLVTDRTTTLLALAGICLLLAPLLLMIVEHPPHEANADQAPSAAGNSSGAELSTMQILKDPVFWLITISIGCLSAAGIAFTVHLIPFGIERQFSPQAAAVLLSTYAISGIAGNMLFGWFADRFGALKGLITTALGQALLVCILVGSSGSELLIAGLLGAGAVPVVMLHGTTFSLYFGTAAVSRAMGLTYAAKVPFSLCAAPVVAYLYELNGSYTVALLAIAGMLLFAAMTLGVAYRIAFATRDGTHRGMPVEAIGNRQTSDG